MGRFFFPHLRCPGTVPSGSSAGRLAETSSYSVGSVSSVCVQENPRGFEESAMETIAASLKLYAALFMRAASAHSREHTQTHTHTGTHRWLSSTNMHTSPRGRTDGPTDRPKDHIQRARPRRTGWRDKDPLTFVPCGGGSMLMLATMAVSLLVASFSRSGLLL